MARGEKRDDRIFASYDFQFRTDYPLGLELNEFASGNDADAFNTVVEVTIRSRYNHKKLNISEVEELRFVCDSNGFNNAFYVIFSHVAGSIRREFGMRLLTLAEERFIGAFNGTHNLSCYIEQGRFHTILAVDTTK